MRYGRSLGVLGASLVALLGAMLPAAAASRGVVEMTPPAVDAGSYTPSSMFDVVGGFGLSELRAGGAISNLELLPHWFVVPSADSFHKGRFDAIELDALFSVPWFNLPAWAPTPRLSVGGMVNLSGHESFGHVGVDLHEQIGDSPFYAEAGGGIGMHNGYLNNAPSPDYHNLGCPVLFHWKAGIGYNLTDHITATIDWQHMSNVIFNCTPNDGLNNIGFVLGYKF